jgi:hypothetical protein
MLKIEIEKVWPNTTVLRFFPSDRFWWSGVFENPLWLWNLFDYLASMFCEAFLADKNEVLLNFITNFQG